MEVKVFDLFGDPFPANWGERGLLNTSPLRKTGIASACWSLVALGLIVARVAAALL